MAFNGTLDLQTELEFRTAPNAAGSSYELNGPLVGAAALRFNGSNVTFGATADNSGFGRELVFLPNATVVSNIESPGVLLASGGEIMKIQVNGPNGSIEINGAETFFGNLVVGGPHNFTFDADADQSSMGFVRVADGALTLDVDASVTELAFADSSAEIWGIASISILGFQENTIRFGTDGNGLTTAQLGAIDGGIYSLNSQGYLTAVPEPSTLCVLLAAVGLFAVGQRRGRQHGSRESARLPCSLEGSTSG